MRDRPIGGPGRPAGSARRAMGARSLRPMLAALLVVAVGGILLSIVLAEEDVRSMRTLSHLGSDPGGGPVFRVTMLALGAISLALAWQMGPILGRLRDLGLIGDRWVGLFRAVFWAIGFGFLGVAVFRLGVAPLVELAHGAAAYSIPIAVLVLMLTARLAVPDLGQRFGRSSLVLLASALLLYLAAIAGLIPFLWMESAAFAAGAAWFVAFVDRLAELAAG